MNHRPANPEGAAPTWGVFSPDVATVGGGNALHDAKPQSGPFILVGGKG